MDYLELLSVVDLAYPKSTGWVSASGLLIDEIPIDRLYHHSDQPSVAVLCMKQPFVSGDDIKLANHLRMILGNYLRQPSVEIALVYYGLLIRPAKVPKGISIIAVREERSNTIQEVVMVN